MLRDITKIFAVMTRVLQEYQSMMILKNEKWTDNKHYDIKDDNSISGSSFIKTRLTDFY